MVCFRIGNYGIDARGLDAAAHVSTGRVGLVTGYAHFRGEDTEDRFNRAFLGG